MIARAWRTQGRLLALSLAPALAGFLVLPAVAQSGVGIRAASLNGAELAETVEYRVRQGDTLIGLADRYFTNPADYRRVQSINAISDPYRMGVGRVLRVPVAMLKFRPTTARIIRWRGDVAIRTTSGERQSSAVDLGLMEGTTIATGNGSSLAIQLEDGSIVTIPSNSAVRLARLRHLLLTDSIDYEIGLDRGRINSRVAPVQSSQGRFRTRTPVSTSAVRGTEFGQAFDSERRNGLTELLEGGVAVATPNGSDTMLAPGFGAVAAESGIDVEQLLAAPSLIAGSETQREPQVVAKIEAVPSAIAYRLLVARDSSFTDLVAEQSSAAPSLALDNLPDGRYFARVTAIAPSGLEGLPRSFAFRRRTNSTSASMSGNDASGFRFNWTASGSGITRYHFQLFRAEPRGDKLIPVGLPMVDEPALSVAGITISDLQKGGYVWRVRTDLADGTDTDRNWTAFQEFTVGS